MPARIPILTAPTAAGKTALALELAQRYAVEIVSADAFTVYRGLNIGTAKPTPEEQAAVPHHLIDVVNVTQEFDVAQFVTLAQGAMHDILARGKMPLVVGGTGFYLAALIKGLPLTPPSLPGERRVIEQELHERGLDALLAEIQALNPAEAQRMERNPRRVVRALEVQRRTGKFPGEFGHSRPAFQYTVTGFTRSAPELEARMRTRIQSMFRAGWPAEAQWLAAQISPQALPRPTAWQALGYREALGVAQAELTQNEALERVFLQSRQYAKRQHTWVRSQLGAELLSEQGAREALIATMSS